MIEDTPNVLNATRLFLQASKFQVITAASGPEALAQLSSHKIIPNLVIADYRLPDGETGDKVIQDVRRFYDQDIPAIIITGDTSMLGLDTAGATPMQILAKPIDPEKLLSLIQQLVRGKDLTDE